MKKLWSFIIFCMLFCLNSGTGYIENEFHKSSSNSILLIKFSSQTEIILDEISFNFSVKFNGRNYGFGFILMNSDYKKYGYAWGGALAITDLFFNIKIGHFNYSIEKLFSRENESAKYKMKWEDLVLPPGEWYFICFHAINNGEVKEGKIDVTIKTPQKLNFSYWEGDTSFLFGAEDFKGILNIMISWKFILTINGKIEIATKNHFIGFFIPGLALEFDKLKWVEPDGSIKESIIYNVFNIINYIGDDPFKPFVGKGKWTFILSNIGIGRILLSYPHPVFGPFLLCADVPLI